MESRVQRLRIGPFRLVHRLESGPLTDRWLALNELDESTHVAHRLIAAQDRPGFRRLVDVVDRLSGLCHPHILPVEQFTLERPGASRPEAAWLVTPYTGNLERLVTLSQLLAEKGGQMPPVEAERSLVQILEASEYAHNAGVQHGPLTSEEILVDRRGSLSVELYGFGRLLGGGTSMPGGEVERDEVRSIVEIGYTLLTGLSAEEPRIRADRLVPKLDRRWDTWFEQGLDPMAGFLSAGEALAALPSLRKEVEIKTGPVRSMLGTVRRVLGVP